MLQRKQFLEIETLKFIANFLTIAGSLFAIKKIKYCWTVWLVGSCIWFGSYLVKGSFSEILFWGCMTIINVYGLITWSKQNGRNS